MPSSGKSRIHPSMSEWLDVMLEEVDRKAREDQEAVEESDRRDDVNSDDSQSK